MRHKYHAKKCEYDGLKFSSKMEGRYYLYLCKEREAGRVIQFLPQGAAFTLPGGVRYTVDFLVFLKNGTVEFIDVKGVETQLFIAKKKMVEALYSPIKIKVVKC